MLLTGTSRRRRSAPAATNGRVSVIDVGSNSVRLVVYDCFGRALLPRFNEKVLAGLGRGLGVTGKLHPEGVELAISALKRFMAINAAQGLGAPIAFATAAVREAADGPDFCERVRRESRLSLRVLAGDEEARYAALGVASGAVQPDGVVGDLGGSSLELARLADGKYISGSTYPLGPLALETIGPAGDPRVDAHIRSTLSNATEIREGGARVFTVGGAWRSIANIHMEVVGAPLHILHNYEMDAHKLTGLLNELVAGARKHSSLVERVARRRAPTIPHAAAVLRALIEIGRVKTITVSSYGVREGVLFDRLSDEEKSIDPLESGVEVLASADAQGEEFGRALADWLAPAARHTLEPRLARAACRLADIGALLHPDHRAELAFDLVARAPLPALSHRERVALALAVASRYNRGISNDIVKGLLDGDTAGRARALGALMRLAADFSGRCAQLLDEARLDCDGVSITLTAPAHRRGLVSEQVMRRLEQAALELGLEPRLL